MHNILWVFSSAAERPFAMLKGKTGSPCLLLGRRVNLPVRLACRDTHHADCRRGAIREGVSRRRLWVHSESPAPHSPLRIAG
jgi:hypothetical protein